MVDQNSPVVIVSVQKGNKHDETGEKIANYSSGSRCWHIVFLPRREWGNLKAGQDVRVRLEEIREDRAGRMMYRGVPASPEYKNAWRDNGDGTISQVTIATNWLMEESEEGVCETRPKDQRSRVESAKSTFKLVWGKDLSSSYIEDSVVETVWEEEEKVSNGVLTWIKTSGQEVTLAPVSCPLKDVKILGGQFTENRLQVAFLANWTVKVQGIFRGSRWDKDGPINLNSQQIYVDLPAWYRQELESQVFPLCSCGQARYEAVKGEQKCLSCLKQEKSNLFFCEHLSQDRREELAAWAGELLAGKALTAEQAELFFPYLLDHIEDDGKRERQTRVWQGCAWYYLCQDGIYGSKFSPEALEFIKMLTLAQGKGLHKLVAWLAGPQRTAECVGRDYFWQSQVEGKTVQLPEAASLSTALRVADRLCRGSQEDRQKAKEGLREYGQKFGQGNNLVKELNGILLAEEQNYLKALEIVTALAKSVQPATGFHDEGGRHFRCECGSTLRATKSEWKKYQRGEALKLACYICGAKGTVCKEADEEPEAKQESNGSNGGGASMADLLAKFNR